MEKVEGLESDIRKILITWRAYATIFHGARSFISQMTKMVGTEPVESSNGNITLLPTYRVSELEHIHVCVECRGFESHHFSLERFALYMYIYV